MEGSPLVGNSLGAESVTEVDSSIVLLDRSFEIKMDGY